jgi:hypothetical protein
MSTWLLVCPSGFSAEWKMNRDKQCIVLVSITWSWKDVVCCIILHRATQFCHRKMWQNLRKLTQSANRRNSISSAQKEEKTKLKLQVNQIWQKRHSKQTHLPFLGFSWGSVRDWDARMTTRIISHTPVFPESPKVTILSHKHSILSWRIFDIHTEIKVRVLRNVYHSLPKASNKTQTQHTFPHQKQTPLAVSIKSCMSHYSQWSTSNCLSTHGLNCKVGILWIKVAQKRKASWHAR